MLLRRGKTSSAVRNQRWVVFVRQGGYRAAKSYQSPTSALADLTVPSQMRRGQ